MGAELSWDEFRLVKAIADSRSLTGAAELLGLNHSTVFRRLAALEKSIGARLFERSRSGYRTTAAGNEMVALATTMASSIVDFERRVAGRDAKPVGELRVTTAEAIGQHFMPAIMAQFQTHNPGVVIELILSNSALNLSRRDADVAIRLTNDPPEMLVGRRICSVRWGIYCRRDIGSGPNLSSIDSVSFIGYCESSRADGGAAVDRSAGPAGAARRPGEFDSKHAGIGGAGVRRRASSLFSGRSSPNAAPDRKAAARGRRRTLDSDPPRPATIGPRPSIHGFRRGRAGQASAID